MNTDTPDPVAIAAELASAVSSVGAGFMSDPSLGVRGSELGYRGIDFYLAGRAGVLGEVDADIAVAALVFFSPDTVRTSWRRSRGCQPRSEAALEFARCAWRWAGARLPADPRWERLAALAARISDQAPLAGAPLFAGWRGLPVPDDPRHAVVHHLNGLREHRMACHAAAVLAAGLDVADAVRLRSSDMQGLFGWPGDLADRADATRRWERAEACTDEVVGSLYSCLPADELAEFATLVATARSAIQHVSPDSTTRTRASE